MSETTNYAYLAPREGSRYEQYFFKGRNLRAETLYRATIGTDPMTPEEVARDYDVPADAVLEAIHYALQNVALLQKEREQDWDASYTRGLVEGPPMSSGG
jgi:uncharacterized protein (DUF433 family)